MPLARDGASGWALSGRQTPRRAPGIQAPDAPRRAESGVTRADLLLQLYETEWGQSVEPLYGPEHRVDWGLSEPAAANGHVSAANGHAAA